MFRSMAEAKRYFRTTGQLDCWVYYSPITNRIKLTFDGRKVISFVNEKGNAYVEDGRLTDSYEPIGRLVQMSYYSKKKGLYFGESA